MAADPNSIVPLSLRTILQRPLTFDEADQNFVALRAALASIVDTATAEAITQAVAAVVAATTPALIGEFQDGTATTPSVRGVNHLGSGLVIVQNGAGGIQLAVNGVALMGLNSDGHITFLQPTPMAIPGVVTLNGDNTGSTVDISGTDLDYLQKTGPYHGSGLVNAPMADAAFLWHIEHQRSTDTFDRFRQRATSIYDFQPAAYPALPGGTAFNRVFTGGAWTGWLPECWEGTWVPSLAGSTSGVMTANGSNYGWWSRRGNLVTVGGTLQWSGGGPLVGSTTIAGLPFMSASDSVGGGRSAGSLGFMFAGSFTLPAGTTRLVLEMDPDQDVLLLGAETGVTGGYSLQPTPSGPGGLVYGFQLTYRAAPL